MHYSFVNYTTQYHLGLIHLRVSFHYGAFYKSGRTYKGLTTAKARKCSGEHSENALQIFQEVRILVLRNR